MSLDDRIAAKMQFLAFVVEQFLATETEATDPRLGFALFVFPFGEPARSHYVSNAVRADMLVMLREGLDRIANREGH